MSIVSRVLVVAAAVALASPSVARAQAANFAGEWELDVAASTFGPMAGPTKQTMKVEHAGTSLKTTIMSTSARGDRTTNTTITTDGKESRNPTGMGGAESVSTASWTGETLGVVSKMSVQGTEITVNENWTLSDGGKTLTLVSNASTPMGAIERTMIYRKKG